MTDLNALLNTATGAPSTAEVDADIARGRRALRSRRMTVLGGGTFAIVLAAGAGLGGGAFGESGAPSVPAASAPAVVSPAMTFVAYTGDQPEGFTVATVPDGWKVQGVNEFTFVIAKPGVDSSVDSFLGKLVVMLESQDAKGPFEGEAVTIGGRDAVLAKPGDGYGILHWADADGNRLVVQWPLDAGFSDAEMTEFAAGVDVLPGAKSGRG